jgi:DNA-binding NtrC family response regulator
VDEQRCAVLIVEDDDKLQDLLRTILNRHATSIDLASDGERAIAANASPNNRVGTITIAGQPFIATPLGMAKRHAAGR